MRPYMVHKPNNKQAIRSHAELGDYLKKMSSFKGFPYKSTVTTPIHPQSPNETLAGWRNLEPRPIQSSYEERLGVFGNLGGSVRGCYGIRVLGLEFGVHG